MNPFLTCSPLPHPLHRSAIRSPHRQSHCRPIWAIYAVLKPSFRREHGKANVTSLVERKSRFTFLLANGDERSAAVIAGVAEALRGLPEDARRTVTFDRGTEFAAYPRLAGELAVASYFYDPHSPWQKGSVENANGRVR